MIPALCCGKLVRALQPTGTQRMNRSEFSRHTGMPGIVHLVPGPRPVHSGAYRLLSKILSECEGADEIEFLAEGSWRPIRAEKEPSCSPQGPILVLGTSDANGLAPASSTPGIGSGLSGPGSAGSGAGAAGSLENGKTGADVVDLTLDSSSSSEDEDEDEDDDEDEDEGPRPKRRCPFQKGLVPAC